MIKTRTFIVGQAELFREGLRKILSGSEFEIAGEAHNIDELIRALRNDGGPKMIVLADAQRSRHRLEHLRSELPAALFVALLDRICLQTLVIFLAAGIHGCVLTRVSTGVLLQSLRLVLLGERVYPSELSLFLCNAPRFHPSPLAGCEVARLVRS